MSFWESYYHAQLRKLAKKAAQQDASAGPRCRDCGCRVLTRATGHTPRRCPSCAISRHQERNRERYQSAARVR